MFTKVSRTEYTIARTKLQSLTRNLPKLKTFMYYGGSSVLRCIMQQELPERGHFSPGDVDLYVDMSHDDFNIVEMSDYLYDLLQMKMRSPTDGCDADAPLQAYKSAMEMACIYHTSLVAGENPQSDSCEYFSSKHIIDVIKYVGMKIKMDLILINSSIEQHILDDYDLDICRNYVDSNGDFHIHSLGNIISGYATMSADTLSRNIGSRHQWTKFTRRVVKYINRLFKITVVAASDDDMVELWPLHILSTRRVSVVMAGCTHSLSFPLLTAFHLGSIRFVSEWSNSTGDACEKELITKTWHQLLSKDSGEYIDGAIIWAMRIGNVHMELQSRLTQHLAAPAQVAPLHFAEPAE